MSVSRGRVRCACARRRQASTTLTCITAPDTTRSRFPLSRAAMVLQGMTAQVLIRQVYPVKAGDLILVHAAAGGTGLRNSPRPRLQSHDPVYETEFRRG